MDVRPWPLAQPKPEGGRPTGRSGPTTPYARLPRWTGGSPGPRQNHQKGARLLLLAGGGRAWIEQYVKGCAICQQNKNLTHRMKTPLYKITVPNNNPPFTQVAMDLITGLPKSRGYDSILTIIDHGCSRAAIFLPCQKAITGPQIAQLYYRHLYPWFGLPRRLISDHDPRFTSHFGRALAKELGIS